MQPKMSEVSKSSIRSERLLPVSDIFPYISAIVINAYYTPDHGIIIKQLAKMFIWGPNQNATGADV